MRMKRLYQKWVTSERIGPAEGVPVPSRPAVAPPAQPEPAAPLPSSRTSDAPPATIVQVPSAQAGTAKASRWAAGTSRLVPRPAGNRSAPAPAKPPTFSELDRESGLDEPQVVPSAMTTGQTKKIRTVVPDRAAVPPVPPPATGPSRRNRPPTPPVAPASEADGDSEQEKSESPAPVKSKGKGKKVRITVPPPTRTHPVTRPTHAKTRRPRSVTPPLSDGDDEEEEAASPPPAPIKVKTKKSSTKPPVVLKSSRSVVAVPTNELHEPPCAQCDRRRLPCIQNISGGACCVCRKAKRKCEYAQSRPRIPKARAAVPLESEEEEDGPDVGPSHGAPQKSRKGRGMCFIMRLPHLY